MLERETPIMSGTWREWSLVNGTDSRSMPALTILHQRTANAEPSLMQTLDTNIHTEICAI